jgi:Uma2 family endonuclease
MAAPALRHALSHADYLRIEDASEAKHALHAGEMYAMAGGTLLHAALSGALGGELRALLRARACGCTVYSSDLRLTPRPGQSMYADVTVGCPPTEAPAHDPHALANPVLIAEVLSPRTADWDMGGKFRLYREFASLRHYLLLHTDAWLVVHHERLEGDAWRATEHGPGSAVVLSALGVTLSVDALYADLVAQGGPARDAVAVLRPSVDAAG